MRRLLFLILAPAACHEPRNAAPIPSQSVAIYQVVVDSMVPQGPRASHGWLADSTRLLTSSMKEDAPRFVEQAPPAYQQALHALLADTLPEMPLPRTLDLPRGVSWTGSRTQGDSSDTAFELSKIAFSSDSSHAVLLRSYFCGPLCARVWIELYERYGALSWRRAGVIPVVSS